MPTEIPRHDVRRLVDQGAQLVDVLPADEFAAEHLPGAINIPLKQLDRQTAARLTPARPVVTYCHDSQ